MQRNRSRTHQCQVRREKQFEVYKLFVYNFSQFAHKIFFCHGQFTASAKTNTPLAREPMTKSVGLFTPKSMSLKNQIFSPQQVHIVLSTI